MGKARPAVTRLSAAVAGLALLAAPLAVTPAQASPAGSGSTGSEQISTGSEARAAKAKKKKPKPAVKVMTRNLYLGADIMRPIRAMEQTPTEPQGDYLYRVLDAVAHSADDLQNIAMQTDFGVRVKLLAAELASEKPDLVGLQEVSLWRTGPFQTGIPDILVPNATEVQWDFLAMLIAEAKTQGVRYKAVNVNTLSDVEAPAYRGTIQDQSTLENPRDVRLTMRDVILMRQGAGLKVLNSKKRAFKTNMELPSIAGKTFDFKRGYQWIDVKKKKTKKTKPATFRFINSHFEAFSSDIAYAQAQQVVNGPGKYKGNTIFVCDCNSDPHLGTIKAAQGDTKRHWAPYVFLTSQQGRFHDTWLQIKEPHEGWTAGLSERVDDVTAAGFDHRIDMVFARSKNDRRLPALAGTTTGSDLSDRDPATGLWPSDHAGVVMKLRLR